MSENLLFNVPDNIITATCKTCLHRQRWQCNSVIVQYCGVLKSNRTENGLLKIKVTRPACDLYKKED